MGRLVPGLIAVIVLIAAAAMLGALSPDDSARLRQESLIDNFRVRENIVPVSVTNQAGQTVVLDGTLPDNTLVTFWDAACGECRVGLQTIQSFVADSPQFKPIYVNVKNPREQADEAMRKYGLSETYYDQTGAALTAWSATIPATYLVRNGAFQVFFPGRPSAEHLNALLTLE